MLTRVTRAPTTGAPGPNMPPTTQDPGDMVQELTLIGVTDDGRTLVLGSAPDTPLAHVLITDDLRRIVHAPTTSATTPPPAPVAPRAHVPARDIQAMIRSGMAVAEVAEATDWDADKVARFAAPILAERAHVAEVAGKTPVRSRGVPSATTVHLRDRVDTRLRERGVSPESAAWDAYKAEAGQWVVTLTFTAGEKERTAQWSFSKSSHVLDPCDDEARWLSEDERAGTARPGPVAPAASANFSYADLTAAVPAAMQDHPSSRRLNPAERLAPVLHLTETAPIPVALHEHRRNPLQRRLLFDPNQPTLDSAPPAFRDGFDHEPFAEDEVAPTPPPHLRRGAARRARRASVPTWDEIMFGTGRGSDVTAQPSDA